MKVKIVICTIVALLMAACAYRSVMPFPLELRYVGETTEEQELAIDEFIDELNDALGVVAITNDKGESILNIQVVSIIPSDDVEEDLIVVGQAQMFEDKCEVKFLSSIIEDPDMLKEVVWHEIGHCAGLDHVKEAKKIMSTTAQGFSKYTQDDIQSFLEAFRKSAGLTPQ